MCRFRRELSNLLFEQIANSNEYLLDEIGVDTAENEPLKSLGENSIPYSFASLVVDLQVRGGRADNARLLGELLEEHRRHAHQEAGPGLSIRNPVRVKDKR